MREIAEYMKRIFYITLLLITITNIRLSAQTSYYERKEKHKMEYTHGECLIKGDSCTFITVLEFSPKTVGDREELRITFTICGRNGEELELPFIQFSGDKVSEDKTKERWPEDEDIFFTERDTDDEEPTSIPYIKPYIAFFEWMKDATVRVEQIYFRGNKKLEMKPFQMELRIIHDQKESEWQFGYPDTKEPYIL